jgi:hypothetical protein
MVCTEWVPLSHHNRDEKLTSKTIGSWWPYWQIVLQKKICQLYVSTSNILDRIHISLYHCKHLVYTF